MASADLLRPPDHLLTRVRTATGIQREARRLQSYMASSARSRHAADNTASDASNAWHTLMQAHLSNVSNHKSLLETLAHQMGAQEELDANLVAQLENMYSTTVQLQQQAESVKAYFEGSKMASGSQPATRDQQSGSGSASGFASQTQASRARRKQPPAATGRRTRRASSGASTEDNSERDNEHKRRRLIASAGPGTPVSAPQSTAKVSRAVVEYEDVTREVLRRLALTRERRLAKVKAGLGSMAGSSKRKRRSESDRSASEVGESEIAARKKKRPRGMLFGTEETSVQIQGDTAAADADQLSKHELAEMPGSFDRDGEAIAKKRLWRTKSVV